MKKLRTYFKGLQFIELAQLDFQATKRPACCMANMLKIDDYLGYEYINLQKIAFPGRWDEICIAALNENGKAE